ncbi:hypothetical protein RQP46_001227 [Phenoliferia psychrophenolica]
MGFGDRLGVSLGVVKSSVFIAKVEVIELAQVPLVHAKFRVKWAFKHPTTSSFVDHAEHAADEVKQKLAAAAHHGTSAAARPATSSSYEGGRALGSGYRSESPHRTDSADESSTSNSTSRLSREFPTRPMSPPMSPVLESRTPNPSRTPTTGHMSYFTFPNPHPFNGSDSDRPPRSSDPQASVLGLHTSRESTGSVENAHRRGATVTALEMAPPHATRAEPKGTTTLIPLRAHTAVFRREIQCPVAIPVKQLPHSSRYQLQPSPLRLAVRQEVPSDGGKKEETKTGEVVLDLSQFVGLGHTADASPRRYLLRDCKTNAILRVIVRMEWVGGERDFVAPPLKSGQVNTSNSSGSLNSRSTTSVNSKKLAGSTPHAEISRTNSSGSISMNSLSTRSASVPASSAFSSSPAPTLLGGVGNSALDRSAVDIIDTIFNRPPRTNTYGGFHQSASGPPSPEALRTHGMAVGESEALVFSTRSRNGVLPPIKPKARPRSEQPRTVNPPPSPGSLQPKLPTSKSAGFAGPGLSRQMSSASTRSKARSVRWDDAEQPYIPPPSPTGSFPSRKGITHKTSSSSLDRVREGKDEDADDELPFSTNGVLLEKAGVENKSSRSVVAVEKAREKPKFVKSRSVPPPAAKVATKMENVDAKGAIVWAKSWG